MKTLVNNIPYLASASCSIYYYDNVGDVRGPTIDGAIFSKTFPKQWNKSDTLRISTWGSGDINLSDMVGFLIYFFQIMMIF